MFDLIYIQHDKLTESLLTEIIEVKAAAWPYSSNEHRTWIENNLKNSDIHVLLVDGKTVLAYLNLVEIGVIVDSIKVSAFGIGNVCALTKGKGWGKELVSKVNNYLFENKKVGLLFCKDKLTKFYLENGWYLVSHERLDFSNITDEVITLAYNIPPDFRRLQYNGPLF